MCCLFGLVDYGHRLSGRQKSRLLTVLSTQCEVRGTDATGVAYNGGGHLHIYKRPLPAHRLRLHIPNDTQVVMGHTRLTTQGCAQRNYNNHPFQGRVGGERFALAHNGVLYNDRSLRRELRLPDTPIETDSYIAVQLLERQKALSLDSLKTMAEQVEGSFVFAVLDARDSLYFVKGDNPLCLFRYPRLGLILYASTEESLTKAVDKTWLAKEEAREVEMPAESVLQIDPAGNCSTIRFQQQETVPFFCCRYSAYSHRHWNRPRDPYVAELKNVAGAFGYLPEEIDHLLRLGFAPEENEEFFYCGEI